MCAQKRSPFCSAKKDPILSFCNFVNYIIMMTNYNIDNIGFLLFVVNVFNVVWTIDNCPYGLRGETRLSSKRISRHPKPLKSQFAYFQAPRSAMADALKQFISACNSTAQSDF